MKCDAESKVYLFIIAVALLAAVVFPLFVKRAESAECSRVWILWSWRPNSYRAVETYDEKSSSGKGICEYVLQSYRRDPENRGMTFVCLPDNVSPWGHGGGK